MSAPEGLLRYLERLGETKILVVGDMMLDSFMYGKVERISPEAPIPVFALEREEKMLGGAGNVVRNLLALGAQASLVSVIGDDPAGRELTALVGREERLVPHLITERGRVSTRKMRFVASGQQMLRSDHETIAAISPEHEQRILESVLPELPSYDALILSDYGKGVLTPGLIRALLDAAAKAQVPVFVDPKQRDVSVYRGATVLSPNARELALAAGVERFATDEELVQAASSLARAHALRYVLVTRGEHGMTLVDAEGLITTIPAVAREVFDVSGAGDTSIAALAAAHAAGAPMAEAVELATLAAGIVVGRLGTAVVHYTDLTAALYANRAAALQHKILPLATARDTIANWRREGLSVGFTNGCFDIMHAGHLSLLHDARSRCDRLIVGLNTDASVRILKGPSRPVNSEMDRAQILAALSMVDAVVLFDEETPIHLLESLRPDVLMKGADYTRAQVVGGELVESYGGRVELIPLKEGYSTTGIIRRAANG
ncbi:MAG: D-glycero-beta-D-manno-heptose-7-phosphate kinase [Alphaproteobacteria bacterium]